jgi:sortase (surface protein transpeptidase)
VNAAAARRMALGVLIPAVAAGVLAFALFPRSEDAVPRVPAGTAHAPRQLARLASQPLRPIVLHGNRAQLGSGPAGSTTTSDRPAEPAHLSIPALGVRADVQRIGSTPTGLDVPQVGRAGWFDEGARPGEPGRAVIIGHLDSQTGPGLFALLPGVHNGTDVSVTDARGTEHRFQVVGKAQVPKATFPSAAVYGSSSRPVLVLITCGGPYTEGSGYRDNVIVYARGVS